MAMNQLLTKKLTLILGWIVPWKGFCWSSNEETSITGPMMSIISCGVKVPADSKGKMEINIYTTTTTTNFVDQLVCKYHANKIFKLCHFDFRWQTCLVKMIIPQLTDLIGNKRDLHVLILSRKNFASFRSDVEMSDRSYRITAVKSNNLFLPSRLFWKKKFQWNT